MYLLRPSLLLRQSRRSRPKAGNSAFVVWDEGRIFTFLGNQTALRPVIMYLYCSTKGWCRFARSPREINNSRWCIFAPPFRIVFARSGIVGFSDVRLGRIDVVILGSLSAPRVKPMAVFQFFSSSLHLAFWKLRLLRDVGHFNLNQSVGPRFLDQEHQKDQSGVGKMSDSISGDHQVGLLGPLRLFHKPLVALHLRFYGKRACVPRVGRVTWTC